MKKISLLVMASLFVGGVAFNSCSGSKDGGANSDSVTAVDGITYPGIYKGTIPAASGPGIKVTLSLNKNNTFKLISDYQGEKNSVFVDSGKYEVEGDVITLIEKDTPDRYLKIEKGQVRLLNMDKKVIEGAIGDYYVLKQDSIF